MELIKLNLEIPYEKAGAEKPESAAQLRMLIYSSLRICQYRVRQLLSVQAAVIATPHQESQSP